MKQFETPEVKILAFVAEDSIMELSGIIGGDNNNNGSWGDWQ